MENNQILVFIPWLIGIIVIIVIGYTVFSLVLTHIKGQKGDTLPKEITIMLIGPESVGKTSVLATSYNAVSNNSIVEFDVHPQHDTMRVLSDAYGKLHKVTEQSFYQDITPLLEGTQIMAERLFDVFLKDEEYLKLKIWDIPGGYMNISENHTEYKKFKKALTEATVFINVLDAVALIEGDNSYFHERATPQMAQYYLNESIVKNPDKECVVLFVVTKCEKWLKTEEGRRELQSKFDSRYSDVINLFNRASGKMAGVLIPVKTLGCVEFTRFDFETKRPIFEKKPRTDCTPQFVDQPLRHILTFALSQLQISTKEQRKFPEKYGDFQNALGALQGTRDRNLTIYGRKDLLG
ncbi:MAG: hypothetical protein D3905_06520 [Candidatus Electrothrix sp. AS4_5]|nr:hypothetical protein [Candidatus Electrothrix gigas]